MIILAIIFFSLQINLRPIRHAFLNKFDLIPILSAILNLLLKYFGMQILYYY